MSPVHAPTIIVISKAKLYCSLLKSHITTIIAEKTAIVTSISLFPKMSFMTLRYSARASSTDLNVATETSATITLKMQ